MTGVPSSPGPDVVGCYDFDGTFFPEGESWHPTLPGQGKVPCINCTCIVSGIVKFLLLPPCTIIFSLSLSLSLLMRGFCLMGYLCHKEFTTVNHACPFIIPHVHISPLINIPSQNNHYYMIFLFQDGVSRCQKLPCPPVPTCGPDDPIELEVLCCPKCNPPGK